MQVQAQTGRARQLSWSGRARRDLAALIASGLLFAAALAAYLVDQALHRGGLLSWYDLNVYNDAGLVTRQLPSILYTFQVSAGIQYTYTPFAAIVFAGGSFLPFTDLRWLMTTAGLASIPLITWLTLGAMGRRGAGRAAVTLAISALALWTEPVIKSLYLGQIEPLLLLLVVWDLTRPDERRWKGAGIGLAAGIKLVPLIFIPYLLLAGKIRQAVVATVTFAATVGAGFLVLPRPSASYWLTGYFIRPGRTGSVESLVNQSILGTLARHFGGVLLARPAWLPIALVVAIGGLIGGAVLSRAGQPVPGWILVGVTSVLVSPISWDHHWVWIVPFLALLAGLAMTSRGLARAGWGAAAAATAAVFGSWPWKYGGQRGWVPGRGLLGWFVRPPQIYNVASLHGWQLLSWNLYVVAGVLCYAALLAGAWTSWRPWRERPPGPVPPSALPQPGEAPAARTDVMSDGREP